MELIFGTLFWALTNPFLAFMGVMAGVLVPDKKTRFGAAFLIALIFEIVVAFILGSRDFNLIIFAMGIVAAFAWATLGGFASDYIKKRKANS
jgi:predicted membrane protein